MQVGGFNAESVGVATTLKTRGAFGVTLCPTCIKPMLWAVATKNKYMLTVLVHYKQWVEAVHYLLDDTLQDRSKVVKVKDLLELNDMFRHIVKIEILERT